MANDKSLSEIYTAVRQEVLLRTSLQNKCVEISLLVTVALAGAIIGLFQGKQMGDITTDVSLNMKMIIVLFFYLSIQELLLSNYIYHTWILLRIGAFLKSRATPNVNNGNTGFYPGSYEISEFHIDPSNLIGFFERVLNGFQPLPLYGLSFMSSCAVIYIAIVRSGITSHTIMSFWGPLVFSIITMIILVSLGLLHIYATRIGRYCREKSGEIREKSGTLTDY